MILQRWCKTRTKEFDGDHSSVQFWGCFICIFNLNFLTLLRIGLPILRCVLSKYEFGNKYLEKPTSSAVPHKQHNQPLFHLPTIVKRGSKDDVDERHI